MSTFYESGKDKAAKGEGWAPPFISCAQDTVGLEASLPLWLLGYGKPLPFTYICLQLNPTVETKQPINQYYKYKAFS